jgi:ACR3 family arsenite transporter
MSNAAVLVSDNTVSEIEHQNEPKPIPQMNLFQRFLTFWVLLAIIIGVLLGKYVPGLADALEKATIAKVSIPIAILLWGIILPMMIQIDFTAIVGALKTPKAIILTTAINYCIQPFSMYLLSLLFFKVIFRSYLPVETQDQYLIGSVILGGAPCTAMVFVWSTLMGGDPAYTLTQVAVNDLILLFLYVPTVKLLAGASNIQMPWDTLLISVGFFLVLPLILGSLFRITMSKSTKMENWMKTTLLPLLDRASMVFLLLMIVLLFISQAVTLTENLLDILIIAIPLTIQTVFIWALAYSLAMWLKLPYRIAGPATLVASSNFFELAVAISISLYGSSSGAALATVVGVLIEVPVMLLLVYINNRTKHNFP